MKRTLLNQRARRLRPGSLIALATLLAACSSDDSSSTNSTSNDGSGGSTAQTGTTQTTTGTTQTSAAASTTGNGNGGSGGGNGAETTGGSTSGGGDAGFAELGVCGVRSEGTVTEDSFEAFEEYYLLGDEGLGDEVCVIRFEVTRVGDGPDGCDAFAGQQQSCLWTHLVALSNPQVLVDEDSACENSELAMTADKIAEIDGAERAYGYVFEYQGHDSVLMGYDDDSEVWAPIVNAGWNDENGAFQFDRRDGFCGYH